MKTTWKQHNNTNFKICIFFRRKNPKTVSTRNSKDSSELELMVTVGKNKIKVKQSARKLLKEVVRACAFCLEILFFF